MPERLQALDTVDETPSQQTLMALYRKIQTQFDEADHKDPIVNYVTALLNEIKKLYLNGSSISDLQTWMSGGSSGKDMYWQFQLSTEDQISFFKETYADVFGDGSVPEPTPADTMYLNIIVAETTGSYSTNDLSAFKNLVNYLNETYNSSSAAQMTADWSSGKILSAGFQVYYDQMDSEGKQFIEKVFSSSPPPSYPWPPTSTPTTLAETKAYMDHLASLHPGNVWIQALDQAIDHMPPNTTLASFQAYANILLNEGASAGADEGIFKTIVNAGAAPGGQGVAFAAGVLQMMSEYPPLGIFPTVQLNAISAASQSLASGMPISQVISNLQAAWGSRGGLTAIVNFLHSVEGGPPKPAEWPPASPPTTLADAKADMDYLAYLHPGNVWLKALDQAIDNMPPNTNLASFQAYANILLNEGASAGADEGIFKTIINAGAAPGGQGVAFAAGVLQMMSEYPPLGIFPTVQLNAISAASQSLASGMPISQVISNLQAAWGSRGGLTAIVNFLNSVSSSAY